MQKGKSFLKVVIVWTGLVTLLSVGTLIGARSLSAQATRPVQDNDTTRAQVAQFDRFLDSHPEIAEQLRRDPALVNNREFVDKHPALQTYLQQQPGVREEIRENPNAFMRQENNFDRREEGREQANDRAGVARFDQFLDGHREIAEQLRRDPNLVNNREFVDKHPALQTFLQQQPDIRNQIRENPNAFMRQENNFDRREDGRDQSNMREGQAHFDRFLDSHREIADQLHKDPSLVNNREFVDKHPELQTFLQQEQPDVRNQIRENPNSFVRQDNNVNRTQEERDRDMMRGQSTTEGHDRDTMRGQSTAEGHDRDTMRGQSPAEGHDRDAMHGQSTAPGHDRDTMRGQSTSFKEFLGNHSTISQQVSKDPSLVKNPEYLQSHPELQEYLKSHPGAQDEWMKNSQQPTVKPTTTQPGTTAGTPVKNPDPVKAPTPDAKPKQ